jgi:hypothetical protein
MARCWKCCKYYNILGYCEKYNEILHTSKNIAHPGLPLHPLDFLELYYSEHHTPDPTHLIEYAEKFLKDTTARDIINYYKTKNKVTSKQRKYLVYNLLHCYEDKAPNY